MNKTDREWDPDYRPILCLAFDGVVNSFTSGWQGPDVLHDPAVPGFFEWATKATEFFQLSVYSSRSKYPEGIASMRLWLTEQWHAWAAVNPNADGNPHLREAEVPAAIRNIRFSETKPAAFRTIDDRGFLFEGWWPDPEQLRKFKPWYRRVGEEQPAKCVYRCPRCSCEHPAGFQKLLNPIDGYKWWAVCQVVGQPVFIKQLIHDSFEAV